LTSHNAGATGLSQTDPEDYHKRLLELKLSHSAKNDAFMAWQTALNALDYVQHLVRFSVDMRESYPNSEVWRTAAIKGKADIETAVLACERTEAALRKAEQYYEECFELLSKTQTP
jgi:hypothetical protein